MTNTFTFFFIFHLIVILQIINFITLFNLSKCFVIHIVIVLFFTLIHSKTPRRIGSTPSLHFLTPLSQSTGLVPPQIYQCCQHPTPAKADGVLRLHLTQLLTISEPSNYSHFETLPFLSSQATPTCRLPFCLHRLPLCSLTKMLGCPKLLARASSLSAFSVSWLQNLSIC